MSGQVYAAPFAQIPEWVLDADISDRAVRVWCVLHRHANADGYAFPGRTKMAERVRCSTASLDRALNELRDVGALVSVQRVDGGAIVGNDYWLWPATPSSPVSTGSRTGEATPRRVGEARVASPVTRQEEREPVNESQSERENAPSSPAVPDVSFDLFWQAWPDKRDKAAARVAFAKALKKADARTIIDGAARYAADPNLPERQFIPHASTWLNKERWNDPPLPPRAGRVSKSLANVVANAERNGISPGELFRRQGAPADDAQKALGR